MRRLGSSANIEVGFWGLIDSVSIGGNGSVVEHILVILDVHLGVRAFAAANLCGSRIVEWQVTQWDMGNKGRRDREVYTV